MITDERLLNAIAYIDRLEQIARTDQWHEVIVGSDIRQLCGIIRGLIEIISLEKIVCNRPPKGWYCGLERDHDGPCPAWPVSHETARIEHAAI